VRAQSVWRCSSLYQGKKTWQCARAASIEANWPGKSGRHFSKPVAFLLGDVRAAVGLGDAEVIS